MPPVDRAAIDQRIREAIASRRLVQLRYHANTRTVEPHDYGQRGGRDRLLVYQRSAVGEPSGSRSTGWRDLFVDEIEDLQLLQDHFSGSRGGDHVRHIAWDVL